MKKLSKKDAIDRILHLFDDCEEVAGADLSFANRLVAKARRIAMKSKVRLPSFIKRKFCKFCGVYFVPGKTYRVRTKNKKVVYACLKCKRLCRIPLLGKK